MHLIPYTLFAICFSAVVTLYLSFRIKTPDSFGRVLKFTLACIFLNSTFSFLTEIAVETSVWDGQISPSILLYGPLLYFGILALRDGKISKVILVIHGMPFMGYGIFYLLILTGFISPSASLFKELNRQLYIIGPLSFVLYTLWTFVAGRNLFAGQFRDKLLIFVFARIALLFLAMLFMMIGFSNTLMYNSAAIILLKLMVYSCMFIFIVVIFNFIINKLMNRFSAATRGLVMQRQGKPPIVKYERSALSEAQLEAYQQKLDFAMHNAKLYLDTSLSLTSLAQHLKLPNHHITQVLSMHINQTFYEYVNGFRIDHACKLLEDFKNEVNLEVLAEQSGFNSKVSFNRQFKKIVGCTPSAYRSKFSS